MKPIEKTLSIVAAIGTLLIAETWAAARSDLSLEAALSAPFLSSLTAAAKGNRLAWIAEAKGRRNLWVADGPQFHGRAVTRYDQDDGQELSDLCLTADGSTIVFVRGEQPDKEGVSPNPTSNPNGAKQEVWALVKSEAPRRIGEGSSPDISADGRTVVFVRNKQLYSAPLDRAGEATQLLRARGDVQKPRWSPDGTHIAFVSLRGNHSLIGVFEVASRTLKWMSPSVDFDNEPVWAPDSKRLAFFRVPGRTIELNLDFELTRPLSIWVADASSGSGRAAWSGDDFSVGFAQSYPHMPLAWASGDRLVFYGEPDGWLRIYALALAGGKPVALTPPECEAEHAVLARDRSQLLFSSNCGDIDRRHIWTVPVAGGPAQPVTSGSTLEWSPAAAGDAVAFFRASAREPAALVVADSNKAPRVVAETQVQGFPVDSLQEPAPVVFKAKDGMKVHGQLFLPAGSAAGEPRRRPAAMFLHGGPIRQMLLGWHYMGYYHHTYAMNQFLAAHGYVALSINYRGGTGYGRDFRRGAKYGMRGAAEYQDVVAAVEYLRRRSDVDPARISLWGGSYGGYLTALGLGRDSKRFAAGVDFHGVHDWADRARRNDGFPTGPKGERFLVTARAASPISAVRTWTSPVLFVHGDHDSNVDFGQTVDLVQRLRKLGRAHFEDLVFPDEVHFFLRYETWLRSLRATVEFLDRTLQHRDVADVKAAATP